MQYKISRFPIACCLLFAVIHTSVAETNITPIDYVVAIVNESVILSSQLEERTQAVYRQLSQQGKTPPLPSEIKPRVLEQLILEDLQLQLAERASITISSEELQAALVSIARQNNMDINELKNSVELEGISFQSFQKTIEQEILLQQIQQAAVSKRIDITEQDITNFLNSEEGKLKSSDAYHIAHIVLDFPANASDTERERIQQLANNIVAQSREGSPFEILAQQYSTAEDRQTGGDLGWRTLKDIPSFYTSTVIALANGEVSEPLLSESGFHIVKLLNKQGKNDQWVQQTMARHILVKPSAIRNDQEAIVLLNELRDRILAGEDFAELAKNYSEDYGSALKGGDLGWTSPGQLVSQFQQVMDNTAIDTISRPFQTQYGWHILQVQERRNENMTDDLLRQSVRNYLTKRQFEVELPLWLQELRAEAYVIVKDPALQLPAE